MRCPTKLFFRLLPSLLLFTGCMQASAPEGFRESVLYSKDLAEGWFLSSMREDKPLFKYLYDPLSNSTGTNQNELRQLMASRLIAEMTKERPGLLATHRRNLEFIMDHWYREEGEIGFILFDGKSKLGANAMLLRTLVWSPDFEDLHRERASKVAGGILSLMGADGSFRPWLKEPSYEYDSDYLLTFYSGEAILALLEYANAANSELHFDAAVLAQNYYINRYVTKMKENYYPAYVPWHTQSLRLLFDQTGEHRYAEAIFALNDKLLEILDSKDHVGRFFNPETPEYGSPHASSDAVYTEGLAHAYHVASVSGDEERMARYRSALEMAVSNLIRLQYGKAESSDFPVPSKAFGGIRISDKDPKVRIDSVQHTLDAYREILRNFES